MSTICFIARTSVASLFLLLLISSSSAFAVWYAQPCPGWSNALANRQGSPEAAALIHARATDWAACNAVSMSCSPRSFGTTGADFTYYFCTNPENCNSGASGTQEDTSVYTFGVDQSCAYNAGPDNPYKNPPDCGKGNPVDCATGFKTQIEVDFAKVNGLEFVRTYNSGLVGERTALGRNWRHNWDRSIYAIPAVAVAIRGNSMRFQFTNPPSGSVWIGDPDVAERLENLAPGWKLTTANDEVEIYDAQGRMTSVTSDQGDVTTLTYTDGTSGGPNGAVYEDVPTLPVVVGRLLRVTDFRGRSLQFRYNSDDSLRKMIDPAGEVYEYTIGGTFKTTTSVKFPTLKTRTYLYNEAAYTSYPNYPRNALTGIIDEKGVRTRSTSTRTTARSPPSLPGA